MGAIIGSIITSNFIKRRYGFNGDSSAQKVSVEVCVCAQVRPGVSTRACLSVCVCVLVKVHLYSMCGEPYYLPIRIPLFLSPPQILETEVNT